MKTRRTISLILFATICPIVARPAGARTLWPALKTAAPLSSHLTFADERATGDFDLQARLKIRDEARWQAIIVLDKQDDANCYRLTLSQDRTLLTKVQLGLEVELAATTGIGKSRSGTLLVRRRETAFEVFFDRGLLLTAQDDTFYEGLIGYGSIGKGVVFENAQVQPVQPIVFYDDFMRAENEMGDWKPVVGIWQVKSLRNPLRSANAFTYFGRPTGGGAMSLAGNWFWSGYRYGAAVMCPGTRAVGLILCYQDPSNYLLFEWTGSKSAEAGVRRLIEVRDGKRKTVAESKGGYRTGQWYSLSVSARGEDVKAFIDGALVCSGRVEPTPGGRIGLFTAEATGAYFDDAWCESNRDFACDFRHVGELAATSRGAWQVMGGQWTVIARNDGDSFCEVKTASPARALVGSPTWSDYEVSAETSPVTSGSDGICFYYQNEGEYLLLRSSLTDSSVLELVKVSNDKESVLASAKAPVPLSKFRSLRVRVDRNLITAWVEGQPLFDHFDPALVGGRAGLYAENCDTAAFGNFSVTFLPRERQPVFTVHEVFGGEVSMSNWAAAQSDWTTIQTKVGGGDIACLWHRAPFFGDVEIEAEATPAKGNLVLIAGAAALSPISGYALITAGNALALARNGIEVARAELKASKDTATVRLRKNGSTLVASVDGAPRLFFRDAQSLEGLNVGWYATGNTANKESVNVYSDNIITDTFRRAVTDWRTAGGTWAVRNRWQCDPRWSFFSGDNFQGSAVLWNKHAFEGDVTVEFAAGIKMARDRGTYTDYGRDIDLTLCADGRNVDSGYSFVFAGWGNKKNAIVRQGKVVAEAPPPKLDDNIHRKWFLLRAEKRGGHLKYFIDNQLACEYEDPQPLTGNRLALWTYRCGVMLSRFRVSAQKIGPCESVDESWPATSRTFYDPGS